MNTEKKPKWDIGETITAGKNTYNLLLMHRTELEPRLQPDELATFLSNTNELEARRSGQTETLVDQKSKTLSQGEAIIRLRTTGVGVRSIVKSSSSATPDILKAFGVGERINDTVTSVVAVGNIIITAYKTHTAWCNSVGILESDIVEISELVARLTKAGDVQENAMFTRKSKTMSKNVLQRAVEDEVSKISALGQHVFRHKDAAIAKMFEDLIPTTSRAKSELPPESKATQGQKASAV
jgi:hypothetical protein